MQNNAPYSKFKRTVNLITRLFYKNLSKLVYHNYSINFCRITTTTTSNLLQTTKNLFIFRLRALN